MAGFSHEGLLTGRISGDAAHVPGKTAPAETYILYCSGSFLETMGIPIVLGHDLPSGDRPGRPIAVVNESFARRHFNGENPVGRAFSFESPNRKGMLIEIAGVAKDAHYSGVRENTPDTVYLPYTQDLKRLRQMTFVMRTALPPQALTTAVRKTVASVDATIPLAKFATQQDWVEESIGVERMFATLVTGFGLFAAVLAAIGLYGLMAWTVARRTAEIGIRIALGARASNVQWIVVRQSLLLTMLGVLAGVPLAIALSRYVESTLYGVKTDDPLSYAGAVLAMGVVVALAAWIPSRRASEVNAMTALRAE